MASLKRLSWTALAARLGQRGVCVKQRTLAFILTVSMIAYFPLELGRSKKTRRLEMLRRLSRGFLIEWMGSMFIIALWLAAAPALAAEAPRAGGELVFAVGEVPPAF